MTQSPALPTAPEAAPTRTPRAFRLGDLDVAPENMRAGDPADDAIPELAETILAAGLLQPLAVRPGRRREKPGMILDGRRRWLALQALLAAGRITDDHPVDAFVETDPGRQAAAIVLTNTAVPVHVADVVAAIGKMLKAKLMPPAIAGALGYAEIEVRRLAALADLHPKALEALKAGRITLRQAKLLARLPDRREQGEVAQAALDGFGFQEWRVTDRLDAGQVTVRDRRFRLVGAERYMAAGGRLESDLFGERPDVLLDPEALQSAWAARAQALADGLAGPGAPVRVCSAAGAVDDAALAPFGDAYGLGLDAEGRSAWAEAEAAEQAAAAALAAADWADAATDPALAAYLAAKLAADVASEPAREVTLLEVFPDSTTALGLRAYGPPAPTSERDAADACDEAWDGAGVAGDAGTARAAPPAATPLAVAPRPDVTGVNHALHAVRTDVATRALIRAVADDPSTALTALAAHLFVLQALGRRGGRGGAALTVDAEAYGRPQAQPLAALDGDVRRRLAERRAAWAASGLSPIAWVAELPPGEVMALLAETVALSLDLREERTSQVRREARAEAVEIAALCRADVTRHWTPDAGFLRAHPKAKLLEMLDEMGAADRAAGDGRKDALVALVAERAAERAWAPAYLSWAAEPPGGEPDAVDDEDTEGSEAAAAAADAGSDGDRPLAA